MLTQFVCFTQSHMSGRQDIDQRIRWDDGCSESFGWPRGRRDTKFSHCSPLEKTDHIVRCSVNIIFLVKCSRLETHTLVDVINCSDMVFLAAHETDSPLARPSRPRLLKRHAPLQRAEVDEGYNAGLVVKTQLRHSSSVRARLAF